MSEIHALSLTVRPGTCIGCGKTEREMAPGDTLQTDARRITCLPDLTKQDERPCCRYGPANAAGLFMEIRHYPDGSWRFVHRCKAGDGRPVLNAPLLDADHIVRLAHDPHAEGFTQFPRSGPELTITPSLHCLGCGLHGFVTEHRWNPV